ncbi:MAG: shikimate kinase [Lachnospiraceae bacterium]
MNHIVLIGFMGTGKTRVGKRLSEELNLPYVDIDKKIATDMKMSVNEIFDKFGEPFFRALETTALKQFIDTKERTVISVGGGLPIQPQNQPHLKQLGIIIHLTASVEILKKRLEGDDTRPLLAGHDLGERIASLMKQREPVYESLADITVQSGEQTFYQLMNELEEKIKELDDRKQK